MAEVTDLFSPATILGWYRKLVAVKYDGTADRKGGRKKIDQEVVDQVLKFAKENKSWGYHRIQSIMAHLGYKISKKAVYRVMKDAGVNPDPEEKKKSNWAQFIKTHMHVMAAC